MSGYRSFRTQPVESFRTQPVESFRTQLGRFVPKLINYASMFKIRSVSY